MGILSAPQLPTNGQFRIGIRKQARAHILYCIVENHQIEKLLIHYAMTLINFKNSPNGIIYVIGRGLKVLLIHKVSVIQLYPTTSIS
jgi:hypothetical protein